MPSPSQRREPRPRTTKRVVPDVEPLAADGLPELALQEGALLLERRAGERRRRARPPAVPRPGRPPAPASPPTPPSPSPRGRGRAPPRRGRCSAGSGRSDEEAGAWRRPSPPGGGRRGRRRSPAADIPWSVPRRAPSKPLEVTKTRSAEVSPTPAETERMRSAPGTARAASSMASAAAAPRRRRRAGRRPGRRAPGPRRPARRRAPGRGAAGTGRAASVRVSATPSTTSRSMASGRRSLVETEA